MSIAEAQLPSLDTPLAEIFDELVARADRGDHRASCRLALELQVCNNDLERLRISSAAVGLHAEIDPHLVADDSLEAVERQLVFAQAQLDVLDATRAHCRGVPAVGIERRLGWWRQAALAGSRGALQEVVAGDALPFHQWLQNSSHLAWLSRELEPLAWRSMQAGDLEMAWHLMNALRPKPDMMRTDLLSQVTQDDGETSLALALYLQEALTTATGSPDDIDPLRQSAASAAARLEASLAPEEQARARDTAREWQRAISPLPVAPSPFTRHRPGDDRLEWRRGQMQTCAEPGNR